MISRSRRTGKSCKGKHFFLDADKANLVQITVWADLGLSRVVSMVCVECDPDKPWGFHDRRMCALRGSHALAYGPTVSLRGKEVGPGRQSDVPGMTRTLGGESTNRYRSLGISIFPVGG
jgi:hypothetical protein